jgi:predicted nuclease of restriction endonuclease-like (RecB) superfamily
VSLVPSEDDFVAINRLIEAARHRAYAAVNTTLIELYWQVGETLSRKLSSAEWGEGTIVKLAEHIARTYPGLRGFTRPNLYRMRQFYEAYRDDEIVSPLVRQLSWTHHVIIMSQAQRQDERQFYIRQAITQKWSSRELERQFKAVLFERTLLHPPKVSAALRQMHPGTLAAFKNTYRPARVES